MAKGTMLGSRELRTVFDLHDALGGSLDLHAVLKDAYSLLLPLIGADYAALAVTGSGSATDFEWIVQNLPSEFLGSYEEMAPHDFVLSAVQAKIRVVVRDAEMIDRRALRRNMMYHRARQVGSPIEQVMAVMLHAEDGFHSGLSLYRNRPRPFTVRDQRMLQLVTPAIANAVRNCRSFVKASRRDKLLEALLGVEERAVVVVRSSAQEVDRTAAATALLDRWFNSAECGAGRLPRALLDGLVEARAAWARGHMAPWPWKRDGDAADLRGKFLALPESGGEPCWVLVLREVPHVPPVPIALAKKLTKREREVAARVRLGWDNQLIADELGIETTTVKTQLRSIYVKLGADDRKRLMSLLYEASLDE